MYIEYDRNQKEIHNIEGYTHEPRINIRLDDSEVPEFKPTWLVRVQDMQLIPGSSINEHYWTLTYAIRQSGDVIENADEYDRIDKGKHTIITKATKLWGWRVRQKVKFEQLVQQICQDFNIRYIWYDQMCVKQDDHNDKVHEIQQMHLVYKNACCALALIPELKITHKDKEFDIDVANPDIVQDSLWSTRIWTLEEAYMSKQVLFVGTDAYFWSNWITLNGTMKGFEFIDNIRRNEKWKACTALWYARARTSTKAHDRIFALVNIFPELKDGITFSYMQPLHDLVIQFYTLLAQKDLTMICFGTPLVHDIAKSRHEEANILPSWTGVKGVHITQQWFKKGYVDRLPLDYKVTEKLMHMTSSCISTCIKTADAIEQADDAKNSQHHTKDGLPMEFYDVGDVDLDTVCCTIMSDQKSLTCVTTTAESQPSYDYYLQVYGLKATHFVPIKKTEIFVNTLSQPSNICALLSLTEECTECFILSGLRFRRFHPVVRKVGEHHRSIGVCFLPVEFEFSSDLETKQTIIIE